MHLILQLMFKYIVTVIETLFIRFKILITEFMYVLSRKNVISDGNS